jgi:hypothetical protein
MSPACSAWRPWDLVAMLHNRRELERSEAAEALPEHLCSFACQFAGWGCDCVAERVPVS